MVLVDYLAFVHPPPIDIFIMLLINIYNIELLSVSFPTQLSILRRDEQIENYVQKIK